MKSRYFWFLPYPGPAIGLLLVLLPRSGLLAGGGVVVSRFVGVKNGFSAVIPLLRSVSRAILFGISRLFVDRAAGVWRLGLVIFVAGVLPRHDRLPRSGGRMREQVLTSHGEQIACRQLPTTRQCRERAAHSSSLRSVARML